MSISQNWPKCNSWYNTIFSWSLDWAMPVHGCNRGCLWDGSKSYRKTCCHVKANVWHFEMAQLKIARLTHFSALLFIMSNHSPRDPKSFLAPFLESVRIRPSVRARSDCVYHIQKLVWTCYKHRRFLKICTSGSYDMKRKHQNCFNPRPVWQEEIISVFQTKMRDKTKYEVIEEIPLEEPESQFRVEGQFHFDFSLFIYAGPWLGWKSYRRRLSRAYNCEMAQNSKYSVSL